MRIRKSIQCCLAAVLCFYHFPAYGSTQDLAEIEHVVVDFIRQHHSADSAINVELQRLDKRLRLSICEEDLIVNWSPGSREIGRTTVSVGCSMPKPWHLFVRATVEKEILTWVLNSPVRKGEVLSRQLVSQQSVMLGKGGRNGL